MCCSLLAIPHVTIPVPVLGERTWDYCVCFSSMRIHSEFLAGIHPGSELLGVVWIGTSFWQAQPLLRPPWASLYLPEAASARECAVLLPRSKINCRIQIWIERSQGSPLGRAVKEATSKLAGYDILSKYNPLPQFHMRGTKMLICVDAQFWGPEGRARLFMAHHYCSFTALVTTPSCIKGESLQG